MKTIRFGVFETNSSMVHALCLCSPEEFSQFENGELAWDQFKDCLVPVPDDDADEWDDPISYERWEDEDEYYTFKEKHTVNGQPVIAFGWYGHD